MSDEDTPAENVVQFRRRDPQGTKPQSRTRKAPVSNDVRDSELWKPGANVVCRIEKPCMGGYFVMCTRYNVLGYLPSNNKYEVGDEVLGIYVCMDKGRVLLSERFMHGKGENEQKYSTPNWESHLKAVDNEEENED